jgi:hypothetical protein
MNDAVDYLSDKWVNRNCPYCSMDMAQERSLFCPYAHKNVCLWNGSYPLQEGKRITIDFIKCAEMRTKEYV